MADDKKKPEDGKAPDAAAAATTTTTTTEAAPPSLLDKIVDEGRMARDDSQKSYARDLIGEFVTQVIESGTTVSKDTVAMIKARIAQIDELLSAQLNEVLHAPEVQKLEATWRGLHYLVFNTETGTRSEAPCLKRHQEGPAQGPREGDRVRPEHPVQEGLRGGVRHLRRPPLRPDGGRLRVRPSPAGHGASGEDLERGGRRPRAVHRRRLAAALRLGRLHRARQSARPRQDLRVDRATSSGARSGTARTPATSRSCLPHILMRLPYGPDTVPVEGVQLRGGRRRHATTRSTSGATPPTRSASGSPTPSPSTAGARRSAASRAAAWSRACRPTPSRPTRATSP